MLTIKINDQQVFEKIHKSLVGFKPYIDSDIVLTQDCKDSYGELIIGYENLDDFVIEIK